MNLHPKHKSLYLDEATGKWKLRRRKTARGDRPSDTCPVVWCFNPRACWYEGSKLRYAPYCYKCKSRLYRSNDPVRYAYECLKDSAKKRNIGFQLGIDEFRDWCKATGYADNKGIARLTIHCDRIRYKEGYHINNIQPLPQRENIQKRNRDIQEDPDPF